MNQGDQRVPCPKCKANNFLGTTNCWQCGSSLPPPEAFGAPGPTIAQPAFRPQPQQPVAIPGPQYARANARPGGPGVVFAAVVALLVLVGGGLAIMRSRNHTRVPGGIDLSPDQMHQIQEFQNNVRRSSGSSDLPSYSDPDSPEAQARREIKRLEDKGLVPSAPKADAEGRIHLQSGGTISPEEWERARQSLGGADSRGY